MKKKSMLFLMKFNIYLETNLDFPMQTSNFKKIADQHSQQITYYFQGTCVYQDNRKFNYFMNKFRWISFFTSCFKVNDTDVVIAAVSTNVFLLHQLLFLIIVFQSLFQYIFHSSKETGKVTKITLLFNYFLAVKLKRCLSFESSTLLNLILNSSTCEV